MRSKAPTRPHRSVSEQARILVAWQHCELTDRAFAAQQGVAVSSLYAWQRRQRALATAAQAQLVEVPNVFAKDPDPAAYRLHLPGGRMLEVSRPFEPGEVRLLAQVLQSL